MHEDGNGRNMPDEAEKKTPQAQALRFAHRHPLLFAWTVLLLLSIPIALFFLPRVEKAVVDSGVLPLLEKWQQKVPVQSPSDYRSVKVFFLLPENKGKPTAIQTYQKKMGGSAYHDTVEALLAGPDRDALTRGAVSAIPYGTHLKGLTVAFSIAYIDVSPDILEAFSHITTRSEARAHDAYQQFLQTMRAMDLRDIVLLVEGTPLFDIIENQ